MIELGEPCNGRGCSHKEHCALYSTGAKVTHGWRDMDVGWECTEFKRKYDAVVEKEEADGQLEIW